MCERLTEFRNGIWGLSAQSVKRGFDKYSVFSRLAAYEDSGLSPEEVQELAKAKSDGRIVVLPCKVGDVIYETLHIHKCGICPNNRIGKCKYDGQDVECKDSKWSIGEIEFSLEMFSLHTGKLKRGLFLTREAAEKAIAEVGE